MHSAFSHLWPQDSAHPHHPPPIQGDAFIAWEMSLFYKDNCLRKKFTNTITIGLHVFNSKASSSSSGDGSRIFRY